jgi:hypothetical protein
MCEVAHTSSDLVGIVSGIWIKAPRAQNQAVREISSNTNTRIGVSAPSIRELEEALITIAHPTQSQLDGLLESFFLRQ